MTGNERWRIFTPILLLLLTIISSMATYNVLEMRAEIKHNCDLIEVHITSARPHAGVAADLEWIKRFLVKNGGLR